MEAYDLHSGECWQCYCRRMHRQHTNGPCRCSMAWREARASIRLDGDTHSAADAPLVIVVPDDVVEQVRAAMGGQP